MIYWKQSSDKGRGVYAGRNFEVGELVESVPVIVIPQAQRGLIASTLLDSYVFEWGTQGQDVAVALGFGSLYNHSFEPNVRFIRDLENHQLNFVCIREIPKDDEVVMNYHGDPASLSPIQFEGDTWRIENHP